MTRPQLSLSLPRSISNDDDCTEDSPVPSSLETAPQHFAAMLSSSAAASAGKLWTPLPRGKHVPYSVVEFEEEDYIGSIPSVPDMPSPYSPPPASLFSGEEWPERKTVRKNHRFPREVRTLSATPTLTSTTNEDDESLDDDDSIDEQSLQHRLLNNKATPGLLNASRFTTTATATTTTTPATVNGRKSSTLLPAVLHLKKDLEESHQSLFLLQEENKALAMECDKFQKQLEEWQETASRNNQAAKEEKAKLQQQVQSLTRVNETLTAERADLQKRCEGLEKLQDEILMAVTEKEKLRIELESVKREGEEARNGARVAERGRQVLETELLATKTQRDTLENEQKELTEKVESLEAHIAEMRSKFKSQALEASKKLQQSKSDLEETAQSLEKQNTSLKLEIDRLKAMLRESEKKSGRDSEETLNKVSGLEHEIVQLRNSLLKANTKTSELRAQKMALRKELAEKNRPKREATCQTHPMPMTEVREMATQTETSTAQEVAIQTDTLESENVMPASLEGTTKSATGTSIALRLGRIREAAERAAFVQDYRRELEKLTKEHEKEMERLGKSHEENLRDVLKHSKSEVHSKVRDYKYRLKADFEAKVAKLEQKHEADLNRMKEEFKESTIRAQENMKAAAVEASSTSDLLRIEVSNRKQLEEMVRQLERRVALEEKRAFSLESKQHEWESRTRELLEGIQRECNALFDRTKTNTFDSNDASTIMRKNSNTATVPLSSADRVPLGLSKISFDFEEVQPTVALNSSMISHSSQIDRALEETEALVLSLVGNDFRT